MAERGVSWENMENTKNKEKMQRHQRDDFEHSIYDSKYSTCDKKKLYLWHKTLFMLTRNTQNTHHNMRLENMILGQL